MKKFILTVIIAAAAAFSASAQDIITKVDGTTVSAKVLEVSPETVKYNRTDNPDGPVYIMSVADILSIKYANGYEEFYKAPAEPEKAPVEAQKAEPQPQVSAANDEPWWSYEPERPSIEDVRYRDIADWYSISDYFGSSDDPYIPALSGIASFLIPGLGQCVDNEWGRGLGIFAANIGFVAIEAAETAALWYLASDSISNAFSADKYYAYTNINRNSGLVFATSGVMLLTAVTHLAFNVWNIYDAVRVAMVKDMYYQDVINRSTASLDLRLEPQLALAPTGFGSFQPAPGLSLKVTF